MGRDDGGGRVGHEIARAVLAAAFAYEFTDPCPNGCREGWIEYENGEHDRCLNADCSWGRVPSRVRLILGEQVTDLGLHGHAQYIEGVPFGSNVKAGEGYHGTFPIDSDDVPVFRDLRDGDQ